MNLTKLKFCPQCGSTLLSQLRDGKERLVCSDEPTCDFVFWNNPTPVVAAIVEHEGDVILARNAAWPPEWYAMITGFLEAREDPAEAILREVKEELNLDGEVVEFIGLYPFNHMNQLIIAYHVRAWGTIQLSEELVDYKRLQPARIRPWPGGTGQAMKKWLADRGIFNEEIVFKR
ncbi:MAG: NUDIX domain-containing protein [Spirosomataceae bacterium]